MMIGLGLGLNIRGHKTVPFVVPIYQSSALSTYRTARANRASAPCTIFCAGDSWTMGTAAYTYGSRWVDLLANNLRTAFPTTGATGIGGSTFWPAQYPPAGDYNGLTAWTSVIGSGGTMGNNGIGAQSINLVTTGSGYRYTFTGTSFDVYFGGVGSGPNSATVSIDGGATQTVDAAAVTGASFWNSGALSYGTHTIDIVLASGTNFWFTGLMFYNGDETKGIRTMNAGRGGVTAGAYDLYGIFVSNGAMRLPPVDMAIIALGINDWNVQTALATYKSDLTTRIGTARTSANNASLPIMLLGFNQPGNAGSHPIPYSDYILKLKEIADADPLVAVLDLQAYVPVCQTSGTPDPIGFWDTDRLHPTSSGHTLLASLVSNALAQ